MYFLSYDSSHEKELSLLLIIHINNNKFVLIEKQALLTLMIEIKVNKGWDGDLTLRLIISVNNECFMFNQFVICLWFDFINETWLILPVVICLVQRLSHACLSLRCVIAIYFGILWFYHF